jgi:GTP diphosphokinase / guanosine-3',5'-bis(diphosphate) 3'-diphosphatase
LDYAFSIHSDLGCMCKSVIVNDRVAPIFHRLKNGDQVRIVTDKNQKPTEDWLLHVITSKAKTRIRAALREEKRVQAEYGKEILARKLNAFKTPVEENVDMLARWYNYPNRTEFLSAIYLAQVELTGMNKRFKAEGNRLVEIEEAAAHREDLEMPPNSDAPVRSKPGNRPEVIVNGEAGSYPYSFSPCCNPVQGDDIFAFITIKEGVKIHRYSCPNASNLLNNYGHRVLKADWGNVVRSETVVPIVVTGVDTAGVIQRLTDRLYNLGINIRSFSMTGESGYFEGKISLIVANNDQLNRAIMAIKGFDWVTNVSRAE